MRTSLKATAAVLALLAGQQAIAQAPRTQPALQAGQSGNVTVTQMQPAPAAPAATVAATPAPTPAPEATPAPDNQAERIFRKQLGEDEIVKVANVARIAVSDAKVIKASVLTDGTGVIVNALGVGSTDLRVFTTDNQVRLFRFVVSKADVEEVLAQLRELLTEVVGVRAERVGDNLVVKGRITSSEDLRKFNEIKSKIDFVDLVEVRIAQVEMERALADLNKKLQERNYGGVKASISMDQNTVATLFLTGVVATDQAKRESEDIARIYFPKNLVNHVVLAKPMIEIDCTMVTVDFDRLDKRGTNAWNKAFVGVFNKATNPIVAGATSGSSTTGATPGEILGNAEGISGSTSDGSNIGESKLAFQVLRGTGVLEFLKTKDYVTYYADQHQAVLSGQSAKFQDGASIFIALVGQQSQSVATIDTGINVSVTPELQENSKIRTSVTVDFSGSSQGETPSFSGAPSSTLTLKRFSSSSVLEVEDKETVVVSGLNSNLFKTTKKATPLLEYIPILNLVFKAQDRSGKNVRSFLFVTPAVPTKFAEPNRQAFSSTGQKAREYYRNDARFRPGNWGFYLGWDRDIPAPPQPTPLVEDDQTTRKALEEGAPFIKGK